MPAVQTSLNRVNRELKALGTYHERIPLRDIFNILEKHGFTAIDEDIPASPEQGVTVGGRSYAKWQGMLLGRESNTTFGVVNPDYPRRMFGLYLSWYKMEPSGRYEIVTYLS